MARKLGAVAILPGGAGSPSNTMWPVHRPSSMPSSILIRPTVWPQHTNVTDRTDRRDRQDRQTTVLQTVAQNNTYVGRKLRRVLCPLFLGEPGSPSNTMWPGPRPTTVQSGILIHPAVWSQQTWARRYGMPPFWRGAVSPSDTVSPGPRPLSVLSGILIYPALWPQRLWAENCGGCCAPSSWGRELGLRLTQCGLGRDLPLYQVAA